MTQKQSHRLLMIVFSLLTKTEDEVAQSAGRDLYDYIEQYTQDLDLFYQMKEVRAMQWDRVKCLQYLKHRLNIELF